MLTSPEPNNRIAVRLLETMEGEREKGYGGKLLDRAVEYAKDKGADQLISDPEGGTTEAAGRLWEKLGAEKIPYKGAKDGTVWKVDVGKQEFYNPMQTRDEGGRFVDEGKGSEEPGYRHPDEADLTGLDKRLVDYRTERPLARASGDVKAVSHYVPGMHYVRYTKAPFYDELNEAQGTPDPENMKIEDFAAARKRLFSTRPVERLKVKDLIATQPVVNGAKVKKNAKEGKIKNASVVQYEGKYYIVDGHHAVAAAARNGKRHVKANVLHLTERIHKSGDRLNASNTKGYLGESDEQVFYTDGKNVFRASKTNVVDTRTGYPIGRWEASLEHWKRYRDSMYDFVKDKSK